MNYESRLLISNDKAIDNMTYEDIKALTTFSEDFIPRDVYYLFSDFVSDFENKRKQYLENNPQLKKKLWQRADVLNSEYFSKLSKKEDYAEYEDKQTQLSIDFINKYPIFKQYYIKINYYDENENLIHEEYLK